MPRNADLYASIMKSLYDESGDSHIYKPAVGTDEETFEYLEKEKVIRRSKVDAAIVTFLPKGYAS